MTEFEVEIIVREKTQKMFEKGSEAKTKWSKTSDLNAQKILKDILENIPTNLM